MTVERQTGFGAQRVAGAQAARLHAKWLARCEHLAHHFFSLVGMYEQLKAHFLAGVASARDDQINAAHNSITQLRALEFHNFLAVGIANAHRQQNITRARPLQRNIHAHIGAFFGIAQVAQIHAAAKSLRPRAGVVNFHCAISHSIEPGPVFVVVGGVDHHQIDFFGPAVNQQVVNDFGIGGQEMGIKRLTHAQRSNIVAAHAVEESRRVRPFGLIHTHVCGVENPGGFTHGHVFFHHRAVTHRHLPPGKRHHAPAQFDVQIIERGAAHRAFFFFPYKFG